MSVGDAIRHRLRALAKERGTTTELMLSRWTAERFLARLAASRHAERITLKGGFLFTAWEGDLLRSTADLDLHAEEVDVAATQRLLTEIAGLNPPPSDGVKFDLDAAQGHPLVGGRLPGLRLTVPAAVGSAFLRLKIDVGFGHPIRPGAEIRQYPTLLPGFAPFPIKCYPRETVVAEKLAVAVEFGRDNTRIRDYYDLWYLSARYSYFGHILSDAVLSTFAQRDAGRFLARMDGYWEAAFDEEFAASRTERAWRNWIADHAPNAAPSSLREAVAEVGSFAMPVLLAAREGTRFQARWSPGLGWSSPNKGASHG